MFDEKGWRICAEVFKGWSNAHAKLHGIALAKSVPGPYRAKMEPLISGEIESLIVLVSALTMPGGEQDRHGGNTATVYTLSNQVRVQLGKQINPPGSIEKDVKSLRRWRNKRQAHFDIRPVEQPTGALRIIEKVVSDIQAFLQAVFSLLPSNQPDNHWSFMFNTYAIKGVLDRVRDHQRPSPLGHIALTLKVTSTLHDCLRQAIERGTSALNQSSPDQKTARMALEDMNEWFRQYDDILPRMLLMASLIYDED